MLAQPWIPWTSHLRRTDLHWLPVTLALLALPSCNTGSLRAANPIRGVDGGPSRITIDRTAENSVLQWSLVNIDEIRELDKPNNKDKSVSDLKKLFATTDPASLRFTASNAEPKGKGSVEVILPKGDYGDVYLLKVIEKREATDPDTDALRSTVRVLDDREPAGAIGTHVGLLFVPRLDTAITSAMASFYPGRLAAIDKAGAPSRAWITDGMSIDAGVAGGAVLGDGAPELEGRTAFALGLGYLFTKGWGFKTGALVYLDSTDGDDLSASWYIGMTYDVLSGLHSASK